MTLNIRTFVAGPFQTNAYLAWDDETLDAMIVDAPPDAGAPMLDTIRAERLHPRLIVLTHSHWDHIVDTNLLARTTGASVAAHPDSVPALTDPNALFGGGMLPVQAEPVAPNMLLDDGDTVELGGFLFHVIATPGHAPGQISLYEPGQRVLFGGDTLFARGYGRTDIPGASVEQTLATFERLLELPDDVVVLPGHGPSTTIGDERDWLQRAVDRGAL